MTIWRVTVEGQGSSWCYFNEFPTVGEVVDFILTENKNVAPPEKLRELAARYVEWEGSEACSLGIGVLLRADHVRVNILPQRLRETRGRDV